MKTGRPVLNKALTPDLNKIMRNVCPASPGAKDWQPTAWSPRTKLLYVPHQHLCMNFKTADVGYIAGTPFVGADVDMYAGPGGYRGEFMAWDPVARRRSGRSRRISRSGAARSSPPATSPSTAPWTAGSRPSNAKTGEVLVEVPRRLRLHRPADHLSAAATAVNTSPFSGVGGWSGAVALAEIDPRVRNGALGFTGAMQDLPAYTKGGSELLVFAVPKEASVQASTNANEEARRCHSCCNQNCWSLAWLRAPS